MGKKYPSSFDEMMIFLTLPLNRGWVSITGKRNPQEQSPQTPGFLKTGDQCIIPSASPAFKQDFLPFLKPLPLKRGAGCCGGAGEPRLRRGRPCRRVPGCPTVSRTVPPCPRLPRGQRQGGCPSPRPLSQAASRSDSDRGCFGCRYLLAASREEIYPPGIWVIIYPQKKEPWIMPTVSGSQLNFAFFQCKGPAGKERKRRGKL